MMGDMTQGLADLAAARLRAELAYRDLSPSAFGKQIGTDETWVRRRMRRQRGITLEDLERIAQGLELPATFFVEREAVNV